MKVSIVIPVYKSTTTLKDIADRIELVFLDLEEWDYEIVFVNDSPLFSETADCLQAICCNSSKVVVVELMKNSGQQPATLCGIAHADGDYVLTMDDDLQHAPEEIPLLLERSQHDAVIARFLSKKHPFFNRFTSRIKGYFDTVVLGKPKGVVLSPFRLIKARVAKLMLERNTPYPFIPALLFEITGDIVNVDLEHFARVSGKSHYTFSKRLGVFSNLIINNSSLLLRLVGLSGIVTAILAFFYALVIMVRKIAFGSDIAGWSSTIVAILFIGGMVLLALGVVGEYLLRIMAAAEHRPTYFVRNCYRKKQE